MKKKKKKKKEKKKNNNNNNNKPSQNLPSLWRLGLVRAIEHRARPETVWEIYVLRDGIPFADKKFEEKIKVAEGKQPTLKKK